MHFTPGLFGLSIEKAETGLFIQYKLSCTKGRNVVKAV